MSCDDIHYECPDNCGGCCCFNDNPPCNHCVDHGHLKVTVDEMIEGTNYKHIKLLQGTVFQKEGDMVRIVSGFNGETSFIKPGKGQKFIEIKEQ